MRQRLQAEQVQWGNRRCNLIVLVFDWPVIPQAVYLTIRCEISPFLKEGVGFGSVMTRRLHLAEQVTNATSTRMSFSFLSVLYPWHWLLHIQITSCVQQITNIIKLSISLLVFVCEYPEDVCIGALI
jgi:hypothetical protein